MTIVVSSIGDLLTAVLVATMAALAIYYGKRFQQPWKQAQGAMLIFLALYFFLDAWDLNGELMRGGWFCLAFDIFCVFNILHLRRAARA